MTDPVPEIVQRFAGEYFVLNSISTNRRAQVLRTLRDLRRFTGKTLEETEATDLREWMVHLLDVKGQAASTVGWKLKMVKPFFGWCWEQQIINAEHLMRIQKVSAPRGSRSSQPRPYSRKDLDRLWATLDARYPYTTPLILQRWQNGTSPYAPKVKKHAMRLQFEAIIELALVCGLRIGEVYRLSIDDVHWDNKYIVVHGKRVDQNPKVREVPYPESTRAAIRAWFKIRALLEPEPGLPLWLSVTGPEPAAGMTPKRMHRLMLKLGGFEMHRLRHTCATERLRAGMEIQELQRLLGHSNIGQTLSYAKLVSRDVHKASERIDADFQRAIKRAA